MKRCLLCALLVVAASCVESSGPPPAGEDLESYLVLGGGRSDFESVLVQALPGGEEIARGKRLVVTANLPDGDGVSFTLREASAGTFPLLAFGGDGGSFTRGGALFVITGGEAEVTQAGADDGARVDVTLRQVEGRGACGEEARLDEVVIQALVEHTLDDALRAAVPDETGFVLGRFHDGADFRPFFGGAGSYTRSNSAGHATLDVETNEECEDDGDTWGIAMSFDRQTLQAATYALTVNSTVDQIPLVFMRAFSGAQITGSWIAIDGTITLHSAPGDAMEPFFTATLENVTLQRVDNGGNLVAGDLLALVEAEVRAVKP